MTWQIHIRDSENRQETWVPFADLVDRLRSKLGAGFTFGKKKGGSPTTAARIKPATIRGLAEALRMPGAILVVEAGGTLRALPPAPGCVVGWSAEGQPTTYPIGSLGGAGAPTGKAARAEHLAASPWVWWLQPGGETRRPAVLLPDRDLGGVLLKRGEFFLAVLLDSATYLRDGHDDLGRRQSGLVRTTISSAGPGVGQFTRALT